MRSYNFLAVVPYISLLLFPLVICEDVFHEQLLLKPLSSGKLLSHFQFTIHSGVDFSKESDFVHFKYFPRSFGQLIPAYGIQELHLSLTQGLWRTEDWGYPIRSAPPGAEVYGWFSSSEKLDTRWQGLTNGLAGLLCASFNSVNEAMTSQPRQTLQPEGLNQGNHSDRLRYASLPRETVCTENLTPFKKLLPCSDKSGIAKLLRAKSVMDGTYRSLGLHMRPVCKVPGKSSCSELIMELTLSLTVVTDLLSFKSSSSWTFKQLYSQALTGSCPLATVSRVMVDITGNQTFYTASLSPKHYTVETISVHGHSRTLAGFDLHDVNKDTPLNVALRFQNLVKYTKLPKPSFFMERFATGYGDQEGGFVLRLHNTNALDSLSVVYMENVLWYFRLYLHTLKASLNGRHLDVWSNLTYHASKDRKSPHLLEYSFDLPPSSVLEVRVEFDKAFLIWNEFPPDAHHGFYAGSGVARVASFQSANSTGLPALPSCYAMPGSDSSSPVVVHSQSLLIMLPTPDFSMPYNVICLSCTVVAIAFGSLHNLSIKRFTLKENSSASLKSHIVRIFTG